MTTSSLTQEGSTTKSASTVGVTIGYDRNAPAVMTQELPSYSWGAKLSRGRKHLCASTQLHFTDACLRQAVAILMVASSSSDVDIAADRIARSYPPICKDLIIDIQVNAQPQVSCVPWSACRALHACPSSIQRVALLSFVPRRHLPRMGGTQLIEVHSCLYGQSWLVSGTMCACDVHSWEGA